MNSRREIEDYQRQRRAETFEMVVESIRWAAQVATPLLLVLILWKVW